MSKSKSTLLPILEFNFAMILMGTSGAFGRYIDLPAELSIAIRCLLGALFLGIFCWIRGVSFRLNSRKDVLNLVFISVLVLFHWTTYFIALQKSTVAIAMLSLFTYPIFTTFLEPLFYKTKLQPVHLLLAFLTLVGVALLAPSFDLNNQYLQGILWGLASAVGYSCRNLFVKKQVGVYSGMTLMFYQLLFGGVIFLPLLFVYDLNPAEEQWIPLVGLSLITTAIGHTMFVLALRHFTVTSMSIMSTIQPIYGILIGIIFLGEIPGLRAVAGGVLILTTVVIESARSARK
ncbi:MAG: DMT family transporter [Cytophagales bacterium]|nr:DMT family transporter [Cytophagales bacterium]